MTTLTLGDVAFQDFEIPESLPFGGRQSLIVHKLPGGSRKINAMGPDDSERRWTGRFRGYQAEQRAKRLDYLRKQGKLLLLTWSTFRYRVLIESFEGEFRQPFEIPYSISCVVLTDESSPNLPIVPGLDRILGSDLASAITLGGAINIGSISAAVGAVQTVVGTVNTLKNAPLTSINAVASTIETAQTATLGAITQAEGGLTAAGLFTPGNSPSSLVSSLTAQANGFGQLNNLYQMGNTLTRMGKNLAG